MKLDWPNQFRYRAPKLSYERQDGRLCVTAVEQFSPAQFAVTAVVELAILVYIAFHLRALTAETAVWSFCFFCIGGWSLYSSLHTDTATLEVTNFSFRFWSKQNTGEILRSGIGDMRFGCGDSDSNTPQGLYASGDLVLPYLTEEQVFEVKDEIYKMFPDTPSGIGKPSHLINLGLNR